MAAGVDCRVSEHGYTAMTASLRRACDAVGAPLGLVLEGGYSLKGLCDSVAALAPVLTAQTPTSVWNLPQIGVIAAIEVGMIAAG